MPRLSSTRFLKLWVRTWTSILISAFFVITLFSRYGPEVEQDSGNNHFLPSHRTLERQDFKPEELGSIEEVHRRRRAGLVRACNQSESSPLNWTLSEDLFLSNLIVDKKHGLTYCSVLKAGSTFWKRLLGVTSGKRSEKNPYDIPAILDHDKYLDNLNKENPVNIDTILSQSLKFVFTREPYSRLFSMYIDKIFTPRPFYLPLRQAILHKSGATRAGFGPYDHCAADVSFAEFLDFVVYSVQTNSQADQHFSPMYQTCRPCDVKYDIIGHMDTFWKDTVFVLNNKGLAIRGMDRDQTAFDAIVDMVDSVFHERNDSQNCVPFDVALKTVWKKAIIRGIISKDKQFQEKFISNSSVTKADFQAAMIEAHKLSTQNLDRLQNRKQAMIEAYRTVPRHNLLQYLRLFRPDFEIFGYDMFPVEIFSNKPVKSTFSFFT